MYVICTSGLKLMFLAATKSFRMWWPGSELNRRRQPFQGCALPTELPGQDLVGHFSIVASEPTGALFRIVQHKMILKLGLFPIQDDRENGRLGIGVQRPDADTHAERRGSDRA